MAVATPITPAAPAELIEHAPLAVLRHAFVCLMHDLDTASEADRTLAFHKDRTFPIEDDHSPSYWLRKSERAWDAVTDACGVLADATVSVPEDCPLRQMSFVLLAAIGSDDDMEFGRIAAMARQLSEEAAAACRPTALHRDRVQVIRAALPRIDALRGSLFPDTPELTATPTL